MSIFKPGDTVLRIKGEELQGVDINTIHVVLKIDTDAEMTLVGKKGTWLMSNFVLVQKPNYEIY